MNLLEPAIDEVSVSLRVWEYASILVSGTHKQGTWGRALSQTQRKHARSQLSLTLSHALRYLVSRTFSPFARSLSLSHTNTSAMTQASRMCFLSAQLSSGSPRHEITWIRDDRLSDQRKTASPRTHAAPPAPPALCPCSAEQSKRCVAGDPSHMVRCNFTHGIHLLRYLLMINRGTTRCQLLKNKANIRRLMIWQTVE